MKETFWGGKTIMEPVRHLPTMNGEFTIPCKLCGKQLLFQDRTSGRVQLAACWDCLEKLA